MLLKYYNLRTECKLEEKSVCTFFNSVYNFDIIQSENFTRTA